MRLWFFSFEGIFHRIAAFDIENENERRRRVHHTHTHTRRAHIRLNRPSALLVCLWSACYLLIWNLFFVFCLSQIDDLFCIFHCCYAQCPFLYCHSSHKLCKFSKLHWLNMPPCTHIHRHTYASDEHLLWLRMYMYMWAVNTKCEEQTNFWAKQHRNGIGQIPLVEFSSIRALL